MEQRNFLSVGDNTFPRFFSGKDLYCMLMGAFKKLEEYIDLINNINVFPVPDGDTGINMYQTFRSIVNEFKHTRQINHCGKVISTASMGAFRGSVGNSGIILAEYFRGLKQTWKHFHIIDSVLFAKGLLLAAKFAYEAVENPREGTILTVAQVIADTGMIWADTMSSPHELLFSIFDEAKMALLDTHRLLQEANFAGVVDAGAIGLVLIFEGFIDAIKEELPHPTLSLQTIDDDLLPFLEPKLNFSMIEPEFELIFRISNLMKPLDLIKVELRKAGNCLLVICNDSLSEIKVHIHCSNPKDIIAKIKDYVGFFEVISIQALHEQYREHLKRIEETMKVD
ncbi:MAG: DAK2 domain-containing protein [Candidatus Thorarchaeota archaeon]